MALLSSDQNPVSGYSHPLSEEARAALEKEKEENEENEVGFDPLQAAALSAGASLLRNSGWRNTPMSLGEGIGHAIPAGMQAYYNQDAMNRQEEQGLYERQQAEQEAQAAQQAEEDEARAAKQAVIDAANLAKQEQDSFGEMMNELGLSIGQQKTMLRFYKKNPKEASAYLAKQLMDKDKGKTKILTPEQIKENHLEAGQMYQQTPNGTISVLPSARKEGTWKFMTTAEKDAAGLPVKQVWQRNDSGGIKKADIGEATKTGNAFRENIVKEIDGVKQVMRILFSPEGVELKVLGPTALEETPAIVKGYSYPNATEFAVKFPSELWPSGALTAVVDSDGQIKGFNMTGGGYKPSGAKGIELRQSEDRITIAGNTLELSEEKFEKQQINYEAKATQDMLQQGRENKWTKGRVNREEYAHEAKMAQMAKNFEDKTSYISKEEFLKENDAGDTLPAGVAFVEMADGKITKYLNKDFSTWVEPLNRAGHELVKEELATLYKEHEFSADEKHIIRGLRLDGDHMEALKKAHEFMQSQGKLIPAPASILKKYQSDAVVVKHARKALEMLNDPDIGKIIKANAGFFTGRAKKARSYWFPDDRWGIKIY